MVNDREWEWSIVSQKEEPWYVKSFQEDYLKIYAHRTDEAAQHEVEQIISILDMQPERNKEQRRAVLDLCCGNGRHSRQLARKGFQVTGIDLSSTLLKEAISLQKQGAALSGESNSSGQELASSDESGQGVAQKEEIRYEQYDVREIPYQNEFDYVLNLFTSFGYFDEMAENEKVFQSIHRALKKEGQFLIDYLNPGLIKRNLVPYSERQVDQLFIIEKRRIEGRKVIKNIEIRAQDGVRHYEEQVNLFELAEMEEMLKQSGLSIEHVYGNFDQSAYMADSSERMIIIGKK